MDRIEAIKELEVLMKSYYSCAIWDKTTGSSSLGAIVIGKYQISVSPKSQQGKLSAGLTNEHVLFDMIKSILECGCMNITFKDKQNKEYKLNNVISYKDAGRDTKGRKKADIVLVDCDDIHYPISIKKDNAEMWESADSYWAKKAKQNVDELIAENKVLLSDFKNVKRLTPNIAKYATKIEAIDVVFGSDLLPYGCVLEKTFTGEYNIKNDTAYIDVSKIITSLDDLKNEYGVWFLIRNDSSRKGSKIYSGLRVLAVKESRINKNVMRI